jgi:hypothetical protein
MRESCMYGSARGALSNGCPYRNRRTFHRTPRRRGGSVAAEARVGGTQSHRRRYSIPTGPPRATL